MLTETATADGIPSTVRALHRRPALPGVVLLLVYLVLGFLVDPDGSLGTDTGAKVYTLEVMERTGSWRPDVGYWAEDVDPDGNLHPLYQAKPGEDGSWVIVTTLPMLELAKPLYELGGYRATLLLPMLGAVGAAYAARALARHLGSRLDGWEAFWLVGVASPATVYALDLWEHSIGLACMLGATALLLDVRSGRPLWRAVAAGALLGLSATLRNETFVYALVMVGGIGLALALSRAWLRSVLLGAGTVVGFAVPWFANQALERAVGGQSRAARTTGTASVATDAAGELGDRVSEGLLTSLGLGSGEVRTSVLLGSSVVLVVLLAARAERRGDARFALVSLCAAFAVYVFDALGGLGFMPGLFLAFPAAILALRRIGDGGTRSLLIGLALVALPLVYAFQYLGGAGPQWGGRYTLTSGIILGVAGVVGLADRLPLTARGVVALSLVVTALGVSWLSVRSAAVAEFFEQVQDEAAPVVISRNAFFIREGGAAVVGERWFSVNGEPAFREAVAATERLGEDRFSVLEFRGAAPPEDSIPDGVREVERTVLDFAGAPIGLVTYEFTA